MTWPARITPKVVMPRLSGLAAAGVSAVMVCPRRPWLRRQNPARSRGAVRPRRRASTAAARTDRWAAAGDAVARRHGRPASPAGRRTARSWRRSERRRHPGAGIPGAPSASSNRVSTRSGSRRRSRPAASSPERRPARGGWRSAGRPVCRVKATSDGERSGVGGEIAGESVRGSFERLCAARPRSPARRGARRRGGRRLRLLDHEVDVGAAKAEGADAGGAVARSRRPASR